MSKNRVRIGNAYYDETYSRDGSRVLRRDYVGMVNEEGRCGEGFHWVKGYNKVVYEGATRGSTGMAHVKGHCAKNPRYPRRRR